MGLPVSRFIPADEAAPDSAPTAMGLVTPMPAMALVMGLMLVAAVAPAAPVEPGAKLEIMAGSMPLMSCAVSAAPNSVSGATAPAVPAPVGAMAEAASQPAVEFNATSGSAD